MKGQQPSDGDEPSVLYRKNGHVAHITLNRPRALNALDIRTHEELQAIWDDLEADDNIWLGVLRGNGRAFCVGQDLKELAKIQHLGPRSSFGSDGRPGYPRLTERFSFAKPIIAAVQGYALGGGFELALACDLIVADETAEFGLPEAQLGLVPGAGGVFRLVRQIPFKSAMGYLLTGRRLDARRAFELGLINEIVPAGKLDERVDAWTNDILRCAPIAVRAIKEAALKSYSLSLADAFRAEYEWEQRRLASEDTLEGPRAFVEKRDPQWKGL